MEGKIIRNIKQYNLSLVFSIFIMVIFITIPYHFQAEASYCTKENLFSFADYLFENKEYYRSITEYVRFIFLFTDDPMVKLARLKIAYAYQKGEQWTDAFNRFHELWETYPDKDIGIEALFQSAETLKLQKQYQKALNRFQFFLQKYPEDERRNKAIFRISCLYSHLQEWQKADESFRQITPESKFYPEAQSLAKGAEEMKSLSLKNPAVAGLASAALPGLGQMYAHRFRDGTTAFLVNGGFIWGVVESFAKGQNALGGVLLFLEIGWYAGNIYSAVNSTKKYNEKKIQKKITPLLERCSLSLNGQPQKGKILFALSLSFQ